MLHQCVKYYRNILLMLDFWSAEDDEFRASDIFAILALLKELC
jgi:hypothetical protein